MDKKSYEEWMNRKDTFSVLYFGNEECKRWYTEPDFQRLVQEARRHEYPTLNEWMKRNLDIDVDKLKTYGYVNHELEEYYIQHKDVHDTRYCEPYDTEQYRYAVECIGNMILDGTFKLN